MSEPKVRVFFYGSFINPHVLAKGGFVPDRIDLARLWGFDILIETLATLVRSDRHCVYGIICEATHAELRSLYGQDWLGGTYLPEAVLAEAGDGRLMPASVTSPPVVRPRVPAWYIERVERFRH